MTTIHYFLIWAAGYVASYFSWRLWFWQDEKIWTKGDRRWTLLISLFSWACVFAILIGMLVVVLFRIFKKDSPDDDTPASW